MPKNSGESGELLVKAKLMQMMLNGEEFLSESIIKQLHVGDFKSGKGTYMYNQKINQNSINEVCESGAKYEYDKIEKILKPLGIVKAGPRMKADVTINNTNYSIKSSADRPAIINHTRRDGFIVAAKHAKVKLDFLDTEILHYWETRCQKKLGEDVNGSRRKELNLFWSKQFKEDFRPIFNYFAFTGTMLGISEKTADFILEFKDPLDSETWKVFSPDKFYDSCWDKLIFSVREKKDKKVTSVSRLSKENQVWAKFIDGKIRCRLHLRAG